MVGNVRFEGDALDVIHDEVRGVVLVKVAGHTGDVGVADELRQGAGLLLEPLRAVGELLGLGIHHDGHGSALPGGDLAGHELLDGYLGIQLGIQGQVGDTDTALAQHPTHNVAVIQHGSGQRPGPTFAARGPNGIEKKCAFLQGQNYDAVDKENTISRNAEKTAPVCPREPLCRTNGGGEASMPAKPSLSPCWGWVAKERDTSHLHWPSSSNGKMT